MLYKKVVEVKCRVIPALPGRCQLDSKEWRKVKGSTGEDLFVTQELDEERLKQDLEELKGSGIESLAVVFAHSYTFVITYELQLRFTAAIYYLSMFRLAFQNTSLE